MLTRQHFFLLGEVIEYGETEQMFSRAPGQAHRGLYHREVWLMMRTRFDRQLEQLNVELIRMGALCEEAISIAAKMPAGQWI